MHDSGENWICLSWGKPKKTDTAHVLGYRVEAWLKGGEGARWSEFGITPTNNYYIFNLKSGGEYIFRVTPRNRFGWGESVTSEIITVGKTFIPPEFVQTLPIQMRLMEGAQATLECQVRNVDRLSQIIHKVTIPKHNCM